MDVGLGVHDCPPDVGDIAGDAAAARAQPRRHARRGVLHQAGEVGRVVQELRDAELRLHRVAVALVDEGRGEEGLEHAGDARGVDHVDGVGGCVPLVDYGHLGHAVGLIPVEELPRGLGDPRAVCEDAVLVVRYLAPVEMALVDVGVVSVRGACQVSGVPRSEHSDAADYRRRPVVNGVAAEAG